MKTCVPTLSELLYAIGRNLLQGSGNDAIDGVFDCVATDGLDPLRRLSIYSNTATSTLFKALQLAFPVVQSLVGAEFFEGAARLFIEASPPQGAWLDAYGAAFPDFLAQLPQAATLAYLPDTARLEWAINSVLHAPDAKPLDLERLAQQTQANSGEVCFVRHPAVRLLQSQFPVDTIWRAVLSRDDDAMATLDLTDGPVWLRVFRTPFATEASRLNVGCLFPVCWALAARGAWASVCFRATGSARHAVGGGVFCCHRPRQPDARLNPLEPKPMTHPTLPAHPSGAFALRVRRVVAWLDRVPHTLLAIPLRLAIATVFWNSAMTKLANWETALELFRKEYRLPLLPPELAAYMAVSIELSTPVLLVLGLATRPVALILLGMTTVIEVFFYPLAWPTHIQWAAMLVLLVLLCRGAGGLSIDAWVRKCWFATH